ncbi:hypothetical protein APASM_3897 [Actinosynnema pretiosum subsp. pretiosum]|nr:hypothetical protein APASM_3897 [Actinosynnema pretiosum subsp. pretiosum]
MTSHDPDEPLVEVVACATAVASWCAVLTGLPNFARPAGASTSSVG